MSSVLCCPNSTHIVSVYVLIADETTFTRLLHYCSSTLGFSPCFSYRVTATWRREFLLAVHRLMSPHPSMSFVILRTIFTHAGVGVGPGDITLSLVELHGRPSRWVPLGSSATLKSSNFASGYAMPQSDSRHRPKAVHSVHALFRRNSPPSLSIFPYSTLRQQRFFSTFILFSFFSSILLGFLDFAHNPFIMCLTQR